MGCSSQQNLLLLTYSYYKSYFLCPNLFTVFTVSCLVSLRAFATSPHPPPLQKKNNEWINKYPPHLNALLRGCFFLHDISLLYFNATTCHSNCYVKWSFNGMKSNLPKVVTDFARRSSCPNFFHFFQYLSNFEFHWQISTWVFGLPMDMLKFPRNR